MRSEARQTPMIIIAGYYGYGNLGDEALLSGMLAELRHRFPAARFTVISGNPLETGKKHHVQAVSWSDGVGIRRSISLSDIVILGGGGLFHDYLGVNPQRLFDYSHLCYETLVSVAFDAALQGKPLMLYAVGVGPLLTSLGRSYMEMVVHLADVITVRDAESREIITNMPLGAAKAVILTADPALMIQPSHPTMARALIPEFTDLEGPLLAFVPRAWDLSGDEGSWQRILVNVLDRFIEHTGGRVLMLPFQEDAVDNGLDRTLCLSLFARLQHSDHCQIMSPLSGPQQAAAVLKAADVVLCMRLHALIFAAITLTPMVSVAYDPKMSWIMDELSLLDYNHKLEVLQADQLVQSLLDCWHDRNRISSLLNQCVPQMRQAAIRTAEIASDFIADAGKDQKPSIQVGDLLRQLAALEKRNSDPAQAVLLDRKLISCLEERFMDDVLSEIPRLAEEVPAAIAVEVQQNYIEELIRILKVYPDVRGIILYPPIIDWSFMFQRPQQIARAMARMGYLFFYCSPNSYKDDIHGFHQIEQGLYLCNVPMNTFRLLPECIIFLGSALHRPLLELFPESFVVYDQFDDLSLSMGSHVDHLAILARADLILTSSPRLLDALPDPCDAILVPNAVDLEVWETNQSDISLDWKGRTLQGAGVVGYVGALAEWFDYQLLLDVAQLRPELDFVLIGVDYDGSLERSGILRQPNVHWLGLLPHAEMRTYVHAFDVGMIPFRINRLILATSPVKLYEFMAAGKPIVSTPIPDCMRFEGVFIAENAEVFAAQLDLAIAAAKQDEAQQLLREQAEANTWEQRALKIDQAITERTEDRLIRQDGSRKVPMDMLGTSLRELRDLRLKSADWQANAIRQEKIIAELIANAERLRVDLQRVSNSESELTSQIEILERRSNDRNRLATLEIESLKAELQHVTNNQYELTSQIEILEKRSKDRNRLAQELYDIHRSRYWQALSLYWRTRERAGRIFHRMRDHFSLAGFKRQLTRLRSVIKQRQARQLLHTDELSLKTEDISKRTGQPDVVILPIIDWGFRFQRPQQLARQFARNGQRVFYLKTTFEVGKLETDKIEPDVYQVSLPGRKQLNVYRSVMSSRDADQLLQALEQLAAEWRITEAVCVVQLPFWTPLAKKLRTRFGWILIYDCMDDHAGFSTNSAEMIAIEDTLLKECDLALASSKVLQDRCEQYAPQTLYLPNGVDYDFFVGGEGFDRPADIPAVDGPVIGYVGAISEWFDFDLLFPAVEAHPEWTFVFIGSTWGAEEHRRFARCPNVHFLGEKPYSDLPAYLNCFDCCVIPFKANRLTLATNPVKLYEYLAAGKPVVARRLPELEMFSPHVYLAENGRDFLAGLELVLEQDSATLIQERQQIARCHTWQERYERLQNTISCLFGKVSVIIVTWNNLELTDLCLNSLCRSTNHPDLEIIVVDNASQDGTPQALRAYSQVDPRFCLILNETNRGFAAALNQGIEHANGDFVAILNNDVILTPGWLSILIARLRSDPSIGMIGPVSNGAWNESYLDPGYRNISELENFAYEHANEKSGENFSISMLALYCAVVSKQIIDQIGSFDSNFEFGMFEDDDYALRVRQKGFRLVCAQDVYIHHQVKASFKLWGEQRYNTIFNKNRVLFEKKWGIRWNPHKRILPDNLVHYEKELELILEEHKERKGVVIIPPTIGWENALLQRPHQLARKFAARNYLTFFCEDKEGEDGFENLGGCLYRAKVPAVSFDAIAGAIVIALPYNRPYVLGLRAPVVVYDVIDSLKIFLQDQAELETSQERFFQSADLVTCVSNSLLKQVQTAREDAILVPNGVSFEIFGESSHAQIPEELIPIQLKNKPLILYYGVLADTIVDFSLLEEVFQKRHDLSLIILGPDYDHSLRRSNLTRLENVEWLGQVEHERLPSFLQQVGVGIIPFAINEITLPADPIKVYEYLAAGLPVVATDLPVFREMPSVWLAQDVQEFSHCLDKALASRGDETRIQQAREFARQNTWQARVDTILHVLARKK